MGASRRPFQPSRTQRAGDDRIACVTLIMVIVLNFACVIAIPVRQFSAVQVLLLPTRATKTDNFSFDSCGGREAGEYEIGQWMGYSVVCVIGERYHNLWIGSITVLHRYRVKIVFHKAPSVKAFMHVGWHTCMYRVTDHSKLCA